jgi:Zn-finger nucleic acid-binding protein
LATICPKCSGKMKEIIDIDDADMVLSICLSCGSNWLSLYIFYPEWRNSLNSEVFLGIAKLSEGLSDHRCPDCGRSMKEVYYPNTKIKNYFCEEGHGLWIDKSDNDRIYEYVAKPGYKPGTRIDGEVNIKILKKNI